MAARGYHGGGGETKIDLMTRHQCVAGTQHGVGVGGEDRYVNQTKRSRRRITARRQRYTVS